MADDALHPNSNRRGVDRRSAAAKASRASRFPFSLVTEIAERRQRLDQIFFQRICRLRRQYGDAVVDKAVATWQAQRRCRRRRTVERAGAERAAVSLPGSVAKLFQATLPGHAKCDQIACDACARERRGRYEISSAVDNGNCCGHFRLWLCPSS